MGDSPTETLLKVSRRDEPAADLLLEQVYAPLRELAEGVLGRERKNHTLQPTALVHEVYLKLIDQDRVDWKGRTHFFAVGASAMRRILVDHARAKARDKRGGGARQVRLAEDCQVTSSRDEDVLAVHEAIGRLEQQDARQARIVELRFFGGLTVAEVAEVLGVSRRTVEAEWTMIRAWMRRELSGESL